MLENADGERERSWKLFPRASKLLKRQLGEIHWGKMTMHLKLMLINLEVDLESLVLVRLTGMAGSDLEPRVGCADGSNERLGILKG